MTFGPSSSGHFGVALVPDITHPGDVPSRGVESAHRGGGRCGTAPPSAPAGTDGDRWHRTGPRRARCPFRAGRCGRRSDHMLSPYAASTAEVRVPSSCLGDRLRAVGALSTRRGCPRSGQRGHSPAPPPRSPPSGDARRDVLLIAPEADRKHSPCRPVRCHETHSQATGNPKVDAPSWKPHHTSPKPRRWDGAVC